MNTSMKAVMLLLAPLIAACSSDRDVPLFSEGPYASDSMWLCKPGIAKDQCLSLDQTTLHVLSDASFEVRDHVIAKDPTFDCFYVYPTVDLSETPGNMEDLTDIEPMLRPLINQAARFTSLCNVYAPLYHQMTIGTYGVPGGYRSTDFFKRAYEEVDQAFLRFLAEIGDRPFVLMGHSQGSHMLIQLMQNHFDNNEAMRERLISALLIGPVGVLQVPENDSVGGTFNNIPLCTAANQNACIIAFDSIAAGAADTRPAGNRPCVNPSLLGGESGVLASTIWQSDNGLPFPFATPEPWVAYESLHTAVCEADGYLGISELPGDRQPPLPTATIQAVLGTTLHVADVSLAMGDLLRIVDTQASMHR